MTIFFALFCWRHLPGAIAALHAALFALFAVNLAGLSQARALEITCKGEDMLVQLERDQPALAKKVLTEAALVPNGTGLLWRVEKDGAEPSYLYGTIHLSDPRLTQLPDNVRSAAHSAKTVAIEITEILDPKLMAKKAAELREFTMLTDGSTLEEKLSPKDARAIQARLADRPELPWFLAKRMRPWVVLGAIAVPACEMERKRRGIPFLDKKLAEDAKAAGIPVVGLETIEEQMKAMASVPPDLMIQMLSETVALGDAIDDMIETMILLYQRRETGLVWSLMKNASPDGSAGNGYAAFQEIIVDRRNAVMLARAMPLFDDGAAFVAVGALHLPGEKGLVRLLRKAGYRVTRAD